MKYYLLIDEKPDSCETCPLRSYSDLMLMCTPMREGAYEICEDGRCPLRPLPSFKAVDLNDTRDVVMFCHGWNTCLAEITGETE